MNGKTNGILDIRSFIFERELAEIYLLLDHLSASQSKTIPDFIDDEPLFGTVEEQKKYSWIQRICEVAWPPKLDGAAPLKTDVPGQGAPADPAAPLTNAGVGKQAAMLIRAKDVLNNKAYPATGRTVAFTVMVAGEAAGERNEGSGGFLSLLRGTHKASEEDTAETEAQDSGYQAAPSRATLATRAFPDLAPRADRARFHVRALVVFLGIWMLVTCLLSWDVATGSSLLNRYNSLETEIAQLKKQTDQQSTVLPPPAPLASPTGIPAPATPSRVPAALASPSPSPSASASPSPVASPSPSPSSTGTSATPPAPITIPHPGSAEERATKSQLAKAIDQEDAAEINLRKWLDSGSWLRKGLIILMGGGNWDLPKPRIDPHSKDPADAAALAEAKAQVEEARRTNLHVEWAAVALGVLTSTILPIFYGVLGAGAAIVRILSARMRDSILSPRDVMLSYMRLVLGAVIGACIGLFVTPNGSAKVEPGLVASAQLSASALCFIAGFGVEGVFQAFESIIQRVFNLEPGRSPTPGSSPTHPQPPARS